MFCSLQPMLPTIQPPRQAELSEVGGRVAEKISKKQQVDPLSFPYVETNKRESARMRAATKAKATTQPRARHQTGDRKQYAEKQIAKSKSRRKFHFNSIKMMICLLSTIAFAVNLVAILVRATPNSSIILATEQKITFDSRDLIAGGIGNSGIGGKFNQVHVVERGKKANQTKLPAERK